MEAANLGEEISTGHHTSLPLSRTVRTTLFSNYMLLPSAAVPLVSLRTALVLAVTMYDTSSAK